MSLDEQVRAAYNADPVQAGSVLGQEFTPGTSVVGEELAGAVVANSIPSYHYFSTARMGQDASDSVVNGRLKVHGVENLRVADTSAFPSSVLSGPMATAYAMGERAASLILEDNYESPVDFTRGLDLCHVGAYTVVRTGHLGTQPVSVCESLFLKPFSTVDPFLTCSAQRAAEALEDCGVQEAFVRPRGFFCYSLAANQTLSQDTQCSLSLPVICVA